MEEKKLEATVTEEKKNEPDGRMGGILLCVLEIVVGVMLLIDPAGFSSSILIAAGAVMIAAGVFFGVKYLRSEPEEGAKTQLLFKGLLLAMAGVVFVTQHGWFIKAFEIITVLYAGWMLVMAALKLQQMADMLRTKSGRWYIPGIAAALSVILAVIILVNPFGAVNAVWIFVGVSLIVEAVMELAGVFLK